VLIIVWQKKGFNEYKIIDDKTTEIYVIRENGEKFTVFIDTEDLPRLIELDYSWHVLHNIYTGYYVRSTYHIRDENNKSIQHSIKLHHLLLNLDKGLLVDNKDHDGLNNRKENLRPTEHRNNSRNRRGRNSNNKSSYRNVCWHKTDKCWIVQLQIEGKNKILGRFKDVHEAGKFAEEMRKKYYKEYAGEN